MEYCLLVKAAVMPFCRGVLIMDEQLSCFVHALPEEKQQICKGKSVSMMRMKSMETPLDGQLEFNKELEKILAQKGEG